MGSPPVGRDIVVVGASAGGVEALSELVRGFPPDLDASVFVVLHLPAGGTSMLPKILERAGHLPAAHPRDGARIEHGRIYVAPPDAHLALRPGKVCLPLGPIQNGHRPAIDSLFRSAAEAYGPRVIGVLLTGTLDDGTHGLRSVKRHGGVALVQDPKQALYPGMPQSAIENVRVDQVLPLAELASAITSLVPSRNAVT